MYNRRPAERGADGSATNKRGRTIDTGTTVDGCTAMTAGNLVCITVTWDGRTAMTAGSRIQVTFGSGGGRTAGKAGSHAAVTITITGPGLKVGEHLIQPTVVVVARGGGGDLVHGVVLIVHEHRGGRRLGIRRSGAASRS